MGAHGIQFTLRTATPVEPELNKNTNTVLMIHASSQPKDRNEVDFDDMA